jgi:hypothetical protein
MKFCPGDKAEDPIVHDITNVDGIMEHEFPTRLAFPPDEEYNDAEGIVGPMKKLGGK